MIHKSLSWKCPLQGLCSLNKPKTLEMLQQPHLRGLRKLSQDVVRKMSRDVMRKMSRDVKRKMSRDVMREMSHDVMRERPRDVMREMSRDEMRKITHHVMKKSKQEMRMTHTSLSGAKLICSAAQSSRQIVLNEECKSAS